MSGPGETRLNLYFEMMVFVLQSLCFLFFFVSISVFFPWKAFGFLPPGYFMLCHPSMYYCHCYLSRLIFIIELCSCRI